MYANVANGGMSSRIQMWLISQGAAARVTRVLSGDGGGPARIAVHAAATPVLKAIVADTTQVIS
eukprot:6186026-Prymnesium_polylepis.3